MSQKAKACVARHPIKSSRQAVEEAIAKSKSRGSKWDRTSVCRHPRSKVKPGPRVPLVHGSAPTEVCECGAWRTLHHTPGMWLKIPIDV